MSDHWHDLAGEADETPLRADYDPTPNPLAPPLRGTRGPGEPVAEVRWQEQAACRDRPGTMYPPTERMTDAQRAAALAPAKALCAVCPVRDRCLDYALGQTLETIRYGVWAGMTRRELEAERRVRRAAA